MTEQPNDGGPAFPVNNKNGCHPGMSLRAYIASQAMVGLLAGVDDPGLTRIAEMSLEAADALIAALNERPQP